MATLKSLAKATGFSVTTVSRALAGYSDVNEETRQIILTEAERQGYAPNLQARALQTQRTQTIGLIVPLSGPRFPDPFLSEVVASVGSVVANAGFDLLLSTHTPLQEEMAAYHRMIAGRRVDGLILIRTRFHDERITYLAQTGLPFVVFGRTASPADYVYIDVDGTEGQRLMTQHFIDLGHQRIAYIAPPRELMFSHYRTEGYLMAMQANALPVDPHWVTHSALSEASGREAARVLLALPNPPTAIMTGNDLAAFGVMAMVQERGLQVGRDIAVGGFDDIPSAEHIHPGLTTVHQPIYEIGQRLAQRLLQMIKGEQPRESAELIAPELVVRGSSGRALN
ncbi:MAG: substrate-binding domain-containing protein [Anaerolineae bacterium]